MNAAHGISAVLFILSLVPAAPSAAAEPPELAFGADFRYRYEAITLEGTETRIRHRIRAMVNMNATVNPEVSIGMQLASGSDVPYSRNQTLTGGFSAKPVFIDLAFLDYRPASVAGFSLRVGKVRNPFYTPGNTELVWDNDLRPEGFAAGYQATAGAVSMFLNASYFLVEERAASRDAILAGAQARAVFSPEPVQVHLGAGYYDYLHAKHMPPFYNPANGYGNDLRADDTYRYGFKELDLFGELTPRAVLPGAVLFGDYVVNLAEDAEDNTGWLAGAAYGKLSGIGSWALKYSYRRLESNAVVAVFTDDDFAGGGTNAKGHEFDIEYQAGRNVVAAATYYIDTKGLSNGAGYRRLMLDISLRL